MTIVSRISQLLQADLHAVLDTIEEPHVLLKQAVREMEEELYRSAQHIKSLREEREVLLQRESDLQESQGQITEELGVCLESGNDELARSLIRKKLESEKHIKNISRKRESIEKQYAEAKSKFEADQTRYESMQQKAEIYADEAMSSQVQGECIAARHEFSVTDDEVEVALLCEKKARSTVLKEGSS